MSHTQQNRHVWISFFAKYFHPIPEYRVVYSPKYPGTGNVVKISVVVDVNVNTINSHCQIHMTVGAIIIEDRTINIGVIIFILNDYLK